MKNFAGIIALAIALAFGWGVTTYADSPGKPEAQAMSPEKIRGEVMKVDGDDITVKDLLTGKDVKFGLEKDLKAKLDRPLAIGDKIEAQLTPEGNAKDLTIVASSMDQAPLDKSGQMNKDSGAMGGQKDLGSIPAPGPAEPAPSPGRPMP